MIFKGSRWVLTTTYDTWISVAFIHVFASLTHLTEFLILCWLLFNVDWIILTRYLEIPLVGVPLVDTTVPMGQFFSGLWALTVGGIRCEGYISKYSLSVNFLSFLNLHKCFWILLVYFLLSFLKGSPSGNIYVFIYAFILMSQHVNLLF